MASPLGLLDGETLVVGKLDGTFEGDKDGCADGAKEMEGALLIDGIGVIVGLFVGRNVVVGDQVGCIDIEGGIDGV